MISRRHAFASPKNKYIKFHSYLVPKWEHAMKGSLKFDLRSRLELFSIFYIYLLISLCKYIIIPFPLIDHNRRLSYKIEMLLCMNEKLFV